MSRLESKRSGLTLRKKRIQSRVKGTSSKPRLCVHISNTHVTAQIIDDSKNMTLVSVTSASDTKVKGSKTDKAAWVGAEIAKKAKLKKINQVVFDRNGKLYHGTVKTLADAARQEGLKF